MPRRSRILGARTVSIAGVLLVLAGVGVALAIVGLGNDPEERQARQADPAVSSGNEIEITEAIDFDPEGDSSEHPDEVGLAIDGNPTTTWTTEQYTAAPALIDAAGKAGVGLVVSAAEPVTARQLELTTDQPGWSGEVYATTEDPPQDLAGWGEPIGTYSAEETETVELNEAPDSQHFLIWITELTDGDEGFSASIGDVQLFD